MKIEHLEIKKYKQFKDLTLDLTYPKGHPKEGQPLDKICIIGQSGTGKTNLLETIRDGKNSRHGKIKFKNEETSDDEKYYFIGVKNFCNSREKTNIISKEDLSIISSLKNMKYEITLNNDFNIGTRSNEYTLSHAIDSIKEKYNLKKFKNENFININKNNSWKVLKDKINNYDNEKSSISKQLANKLVHDTKYSKEEFILDMQKWEQENENILEKIATPINDIIKKFNLELKIDETTQSYEELILKDLATEKIVQYEDISTGTKNLLSTFIPLKSYNPKDSIILIDEPENSFYPDIQRILTELYMEVGENNQLIMATHSPLIASSFEPWEVVELKFDENNQIYREKYYEGENHVDNYTLDPRMLTWTSLLTDVFDLKEDSNFNFREKKLMEYGMLKAEIKAMEKGKERDEKMKQFKKLSSLLGLQN